MTEYIELKLYATLHRFLPDSPDRYAITPGMTVESLIRKLNIPMDQAKLLFINGVRGELNSALKDGDRLGVFPPVGGG